MKNNLLKETAHLKGVIAEKPSLLTTILSPLQNFEKVKKNPVIALPLIIICLLQITGTVIAAFALDTSILLQGNVPEGTEDFLVTFSRVTSILGGIIAPLIYLFLSSSIQLFFSKFTNSNVNFKQLLSLNIHIMLIPIISLWINGLFKFFVDESIPFYITSLGGFVQPKGPLFGLLNGIEIFAIWHFILRANGLQIVAELPKVYSWIIAFIFFAVILIFNIINGTMLGSIK
ncbi:YIP1 family protein [Bacillus thuringiensis]|uniref:YIP1 family protein n=1 Tax=Bacillus thuringiensis TaxID=1428 RepID=UPI0022248925|nr:YIP1 family protein [Bacillus thuringiensis]UYX52591.1 YIP1 family protein [Bacillus thuringiensis]